jgi:hypothetical protein
MADAGVTAAAAAGRFVPALLAVFKEIQATRSRIKSNNRLVREWKARPFAGYQYKLNRLLRVSRDIDDDEGITSCASWSTACQSAVMQAVVLHW